VSEGVAFQTRARTIDHLGRGQIADTPTAISELWKNAYDAYARNVELHIFDGSPEVAAIFDDGFGMNRADFIERWLVIGTESKLTEYDQPAKETFGLPPRERQGEKGIGRLSAAFLAPVTVVISKRAGGRFAMVIVDWRLFENPFITLEDIRLPVEEFDRPEDAIRLLDSMLGVLHSNLGEGAGERAERLRHGWERYTAYERRQGSRSDTASLIRAFWTDLPLNQRHLDEWPVLSGLSDHGTALFLVGVHHELALWVRPDTDDEEALAVKDRLRQTLTGFTDPYAPTLLDFDYEVLLHKGRRVEHVVGTKDVFGLDDLHSLEHYVEGSFDENGVFRGRVVAFGQDLGVKEFIPRRPPPKTGRDRLGRIDFCIGTFEQEAIRTTHSEHQFALHHEQAAKFGGIAVYRDSLRVMPYGRPDADFFGIEERRGRHAGRYFWAHRRSFGRVGFTHRENPNLRDKAGREGLVENRAKRELRMLVAGLLTDFAFRFFGTDSDIRKELLPGIMARNAAAQEAAERARTRRRKNLRQFIKEQQEPLSRAAAEVQSLTAEAERIRSSRDRDAAAVLVARYRGLAVVKDQLRPPPVGKKLGDLEDRYRKYRDAYKELVAGLDLLANTTASLEAEVGNLAPAETAQRNFSSHQSSLSAKVESYLKGMDSRIEELRTTWRGRADEDRGAYYRICRPLLDEDIGPANLVRTLNLLDVHRHDLEEEFAHRYEPLLRALEQLMEGIDLDSALAVVEDDRANLEDRIRDLNAVAQIGITVEIVGHELESLDAEVRRNLMRLPEEVRRSSAFKLALEAHSALTERLRFLSPLKVAGYRARETITGAQIADYVSEFFTRAFQENRITFQATKAFRSLRITDLPSRIFPAFINLTNNAIYWVTHGVNRQIVLDLIDDKVIVADSGPGVDPDDVPRLFELFFTRRRAGRGVGLYLSMVNLSVAHHRIRYAAAGDPTILPGANFIIEFKGLTSNA
jgi:signal transduction histidine kinase